MVGAFTMNKFLQLFTRDRGHKRESWWDLVLFVLRVKYKLKGMQSSV